jgi:hypothetical protein
LKAIVSHYKDDTRIRAIILFGSLATGTWDEFSDLDLDMVVENDIRVDILSELAKLCHSLPGRANEGALLIPDGDDAGNVILRSLMKFSVRYHRLATTNPNITTTMRVIAGQLNEKSIKDAGDTNRSPNRPSAVNLIDRSIRFALEVDIAIQRSHFWMAHELLHRIRSLLMELFAVTRGGIRPIPFFEAEADPLLQARPEKMLPTLERQSIRTALDNALDVLVDNLNHLTNGSVQLTSDQREILNRLRHRISSNPR